MYRHPTPTQCTRQRQARTAAPARPPRPLPPGAVPRGVAPALPWLRRVVLVIDYDAPLPRIRTLRLYRTRRVDTYAVTVDGQPWRRAGWSAVLAALRLSMPRVPSPTSDFWDDAPQA